jgi:hypothetical protein
MADGMAAVRRAGRDQGSIVMGFPFLDLWQHGRQGGRGDAFVEKAGLRQEMVELLRLLAVPRGGFGLLFWGSFGRR